MNQEKEKVKPFPTIAMRVNWLQRNCATCMMSYVPRPREKYGSLEMVKKVDHGEECYLKYALHQSHLGGGLEEDTAKEIGFVRGCVPLYCRAYMPRIEFKRVPSPWEALKLWFKKWKSRL